jgi:hypothetical protein
MELARGAPRESENQSACLGMTNGEFRYGGKFQASCSPSFYNLAIALPCLDPGNCPHPRLRLHNVQHSVETLLRGFSECTQSARIRLAHAPDMVAKVPFKNKLR